MTRGSPEGWRGRQGARLRGALGLLLVVAPTLACDSSADTCPADVAVLRTRLARARATWTLEQQAGSIQLRDGAGEHVAPAALVSIDAAGAVRYQDRVMAPEDVAARLDAEQVVSVGLAIDVGARWATIVKTRQALEDQGIAEVFLLSRGPVDASRTSSALAQMSLPALIEEVTRQASRCAPLAELLTTARPGGGDVADVLAGAADAVLACGCKADMDGLTTALEAALSPVIRGIVGVRVDALSSVPVVLRKDADATWGIVAEEALQAAPGVRFELTRAPDAGACIMPPPLSEAELRADAELEARLLGAR